MVIIGQIQHFVLGAQGLVLLPVDEAVFIKALYLLKILLLAAAVGAGDGFLHLVGMPKGAGRLLCLHCRGLGEGTVKLDIGLLPE